MKKVILLLSALVGLMACNQNGLDPTAGKQDGKIRFVAGGPAVTATVSTKATAVTATDLNTNGFKVNAVAGSAGADTEVWSNQLFEKVEDAWEQDKWWPNSDGSYRFYATYPTSYAMTFAAGGPTISASNAHDIICAYAASPTYKSVNTLSFDHIFARLSTVTVSMVSPYTISNMSIMITPKVSGTYNLYTGAGQTDGTGWSSTVEGSATNIATAAFSEGVSTTSNDIYLVPGTYTLSATWTATKDNYTQTFTNKTVDVDLVAGKTNNIAASLTGDGTEIQFNVSVTAWSDNAVNAGTFPVVPPRVFGNFGGYMVSGSNLQWDGTTFVIHDEWDYSCNKTATGAGENPAEGSILLRYAQLGRFFDTKGSSYSLSTDLDVDYGGSKVSYRGYDDWVLPSCEVYLTMLNNGEHTRPGSTVNGNSSIHWAYVVVSDGVYLNNNPARGYLFFPDGLTINGGGTFVTYDSSSNENSLTKDQLEEYINAGCAFIPFVSSSYNYVMDIISSTQQAYWAMGSGDGAYQIDRNTRYISPAYNGFPGVYRMVRVIN